MVTACGKPQNSLYVSQTNLLLHQIDSMQDLLSTTRLAVFNQMLTEIDSVTTFLDSALNYPNASRKVNSEPYLRYKNAGLQIAGIIQNGLPPVYAELALSEQQLTNLQHDLSKGLINQTDSITRYIAIEKNEVNRIAQMVDINVANLVRQRDAYLKSKPLVDSLLSTTEP